MRIHSYRAWDERENNWVDYPIYIDANGDVYWENYERGLQEADDLIVMQSVELVDKNGVDIFEGDILRFKFKNETRIGFVEYVRSSFLINAGEIICDNKIRHSFSNASSKEHEVIGNIYENNDLLEVSE